VSGREYRDFLADLVRFSEIAVRIAAGLSLDALIRDEEKMLALERALEIVGEAASKIPAPVRARYPDVPWPQMIGLRHRLAHAYFGTDPAILHRVARELLPPLMPRLREINEAESKAPDPS
jgi:uncharacterized protein with HEPN domain